MNPFDFTGPSFLLFYLCLAVTVNIASYFWNRHREKKEDIDIQELRDPYLIAALRGGANEAVRVATVSLIDRGLIKASSKNRLDGAKNASLLVKKDLEKKICSALPCEAKDLFLNYRVREASKSYVELLKKDGLAPDSKILLARFFSFLFFAGILICVSGYKISLALSRKRPFEFLVILTVISIISLIIILFRSRTCSGNDTLKKAKTNFRRLKDNARRITPGGATNELALLAGVYGLASLPPESFPYVKELYPRANDSSLTSSGCGGSSCGGSSCGGGGCGGGCGGCGG